MILGLIPCRGGSKRLPRKNIKLLCDRPLMAWAILEALKSPYLARPDGLVAVSTEDQEIADIATDYGVRVIRRPPHLAHDKSLVYGTITHAMDCVGGCDTVCLIQATSPLVLREDIDRTIEAFLHNGKPAMTVAHGESQANGAVYVGSSTWLRAGGNWDDGTAQWVSMDRHRSVDINELSDFKEAELVMRGLAA